MRFGSPRSAIVYASDALLGLAVLVALAMVLAFCAGVAASLLAPAFTVGYHLLDSLLGPVQP